MILTSFLCNYQLSLCIYNNKERLLSKCHATEYTIYSLMLFSNFVTSLGVTTGCDKTSLIRHNCASTGSGDSRETVVSLNFNKNIFDAEEK